MQRYSIFETAGGFCGIAWNDAGITRFQLPAKSAETTERLLRRRLAAAEPGEPPAAVAAAIAAARRYFAGEETDFSGFALDLGEQSPLFRQIYVAARRVGWGQTTTYGALAKELGLGWEGAQDIGQAMAQNPVALIIPCHRVPAAAGGSWNRRLLGSPARPRPKSACSNWRGSDLGAGAAGATDIGVFSPAAPRLGGLLLLSHRDLAGIEFSLASIRVEGNVVRRWVVGFLIVVLVGSATMLAWAA